MKTKPTNPGSYFIDQGKMYKAHENKKGLCVNCDFYGRNKEFSYCDAPASLNCTGLIYKRSDDDVELVKPQKINVWWMLIIASLIVWTLLFLLTQLLIKYLTQ